MKRITHWIVLFITIICTPNIHAQSRHENKEKAINRKTTPSPIITKPLGFVFLGAGNTFPNGNVKDSAHIGSMTGFNLNLYVPLYQNKLYSIGINAGGNYGQSNKDPLTQMPMAYHLVGETASTLTLKKTAGTQTKLNYYEAGPTIMYNINRHLAIMPSFNATLLNVSQQACTVVQTTTVNQATYNWDIYRQSTKQTSGIGFAPRLKLQYLFGRIGVWAEASYLSGPSIKTETSRLILDPTIPKDQYNEGHMNEGVFVTTVNETKYSTTEIKAGFVVRIGGGKPQPNLPTTSSTSIACGCIPWNNVAVATKDTFGNAITLSLQCRDTVGIFDNAPFLLQPAAGCNMLSNCSVWYRCDMYDPYGTLIFGNYDEVMLKDAFATQEVGCSGYYKVVIKPFCGPLTNPTPCPPCTLYVSKKCSPCNCGMWLSKGVLSDTSQITSQPINMANNTTLNVAQGQKIYVFGNKTCNGGNCNAINYMSIYDTTGAFMRANTNYGAEVRDSFIATNCGIYKAKVYTVCGTTYCDTFTYNINVQCPVPACPCTTNNTINYIKNGANYTATGGQTISVTPTDSFAAFSKNVSCSNNTTCMPGGFAKIYAPNGTLLYSNAASASMSFLQQWHFTQCGGTYRIVLRGSCGGYLCDSTVLNVQVQCPCICTSDDSVSYVLNGILRKTKCNDTINVNSNDVFTSVSKVYNNSYPSYCNLTTGAILYSPTGVALQTISNGNFVWSSGRSFTGCDNLYRIVFSGHCGSSNCPPCTTYIKVACPPPPCDCGSWDIIKYKNTVTNTNGVVACGGSIVLPNQSFAFATKFQCIPASSLSCQPSKGTYVVYSNGLQVAAGTDAIVPATFSECGRTYRIVFKGSCGNTRCDSCYVDVYIDCCGGGKAKLTQLNGTTVPASSCTSTGNYLLNVTGANPAPATINYSIVTFPDQQSVTGTFNYGATGTQITIPAYICGQKERYEIICEWNNKNCKDTIRNTICIPPCCTYTDVIPGSKTNSGPYGTSTAKVLDFGVSFSLNPAFGSSVTYNKIKVQLIDIRKGTSLPLTDASIQQLSIVAPATITGNVAQAIYAQGDALWFTILPTLPTASPVQFKGKLFIGAVPPTPGVVRFKLRFTYYRKNGLCDDEVCEKEVQF